MQAPGLLRALGLPLAAAVLLFAGACSSDDNDTPDASPTTGGQSATTATAAPGSQGGSNQAPANLPDLVEDVLPSVVAVVVVGAQGEGGGSGVVWDSNGTIVTNEHVVSGATSVSVVLLSGERVPATVRATDPLTDLAILQIDRDGLAPAVFADELPRVGETAITLGNPLGFENTVSAGIVSGLHRAIPSGGTTPALVDLLQTDAAISPGNSGGAMTNSRGEVIGIVVAYIPPSEGAVALGFAIPSPTVQDVVEQLLRTGRAEHAFIGIAPRPLTPEIAAQLGIPATEGTFVFSVSEGGPAADAGIEPGDVITGFDGEPVTSVEDLYSGLRGKSPGDTVELTIDRNGDEFEVDVTLDDRPMP